MLLHPAQQYLRLSDIYIIQKRFGITHASRSSGEGGVGGGTLNANRCSWNILDVEKDISIR
jgi:hypothetical protein